MKLRRPTDFEILQYLADHGRNVATNIGADCRPSRKNVNVRLPVLEDYGLVEKVGPAERSGLYEITRAGLAALKRRDDYDSVEDFEAALEETLQTEAVAADGGRSR